MFQKNVMGRFLWATTQIKKTRRVFGKHYSENNWKTIINPCEVVQTQRHDLKVYTDIIYALYLYMSDKQISVELNFRECHLP